MKMEIELRARTVSGETYVVVGRIQAKNTPTISYKKRKYHVYTSSNGVTKYIVL